MLFCLGSLVRIFYLLRYICTTVTVNNRSLMPIQFLPMEFIVPTPFITIRIWTPHQNGEKIKQIFEKNYCIGRSSLLLFIVAKKNSSRKSFNYYCLCLWTLNDSCIREQKYIGIFKMYDTNDTYIDPSKYHAMCAILQWICCF